MEVTLSLTHNCNLSCRYCYAGEKHNQNMSLVTAQKIVDFALDITPSGEKLTFGYFGGEPLLCFNLIKKITDYINTKRYNSRTQTSISITSNGILLNESILNFLKEEGIDLCISIDGPAHVHNLNRYYKDGRGSFEDVVKKLRLAIEKRGTVQVNAVYGPDTIDHLSETVAFFKKLGVATIHLNPNISAYWDEHTCSKLYEKYLKIADHYIKSYEQGQEIAVNLLDSKIIVFLKGGYENADKCGMGETEWGFAPSGNIYPCERFIGEDNNSSLCLGNIHTGLNKFSLCSVLEHRGNRNEECKNCDLEKYCMNWCGCTNYFMTGHTDLSGSFMCESEKAAIQAAKHVLLSLKNNELFLDHFIKYLHEQHARVII